MEAPSQVQSESGRERISTSLHFEAASRSGPQLIQQFRDVLHHEISSGKFKQISFHQILLHHWMLFHLIKKIFFLQYELLFCISDENDASVMLVKRLIEMYPSVDASIFIGTFISTDSTSGVTMVYLLKMLQLLYSIRWRTCWRQSQNQ